MARTIILGAGFSKPAGMPLGDELFSEIIEEAKSRGLYESDIRYDVYRYMEYQHSTSGDDIREEEIDFEHFMSFLDVEHHLGLQGSDTWSAEGNRSQIAIRNIIAHLLFERQKKINSSDFDLYRKFVRELEPNDYLITFNYDTVIETVLEQEGIPYRLFPHRLKNVSLFSGEADFTTEEIVLLKMHGSIDWFDVTSFHKGLHYRREQGFGEHPRNLVFGDHSVCDTSKLLDGPYFEDSYLQNLYRVRNLDKYFERSTFLLEVPLLISPSFSKIVYLSPISEFWHGFNRFGPWDDLVAIIGFSLPAHDEYIRQPLYHLITNFQFEAETPAGKKKQNLKFIDYRKDKNGIEEYEARFSFVDWSKADTFFGGFNVDAVDLIFNSD